MIYQVDSWNDGLGMMQKYNERSLLPWSHNLLLLSKRLNDETSLYYAQETAHPTNPVE